MTLSRFSRVTGLLTAHKVRPTGRNIVISPLSPCGNNLHRNIRVNSRHGDIPNTRNYSQNDTRKESEGTPDLGVARPDPAPGKLVAEATREDTTTRPGTCAPDVDGRISQATDDSPVEGSSDVLGGSGVVVVPPPSSPLRDAALTTVVGLCMGESCVRFNISIDLSRVLMHWLVAVSPVPMTCFALPLSLHASIFDLRHTTRATYDDPYPATRYAKINPVWGRDVTYREQSRLFTNSPVHTVVVDAVLYLRPITIII